jgi:phage tail sheath protein FI
MPEYLAPGVFVEEVSFRQKSIEGVSTSTAGFIGPTRFGPLFGEPELLTSFSDFERIYGGIDPLELDGETLTNYMAQGVRAFFEEGGRRLYVARTFAFPGDSDQGAYGRSRWPAAGASPEPFELVARFPGRAGDFTATLVFHLGENTLHVEPVDPSDSSPGAPTHNVLRGVQNLDTVWAEEAAASPGSPPASPPGSPASAGRLFWVDRYFDPEVGRWTHRLRDDSPDNDPPAGAVELDQVGSVRVLTVGVVLSPLGRFGSEQSWEGLTFHPGHRQSLSRTFDPQPTSPSAYLRVPLTFVTDLDNGAAVAEALLAQANVLDGTPIEDNLLVAAAGDAARTFRARLEGGLDGDRPGPGEYEGDEVPGGSAGAGAKSGLKAFEDVEDISIVAAPGSTSGLQNGYGTEARTIARLLIAHCEKLRYRVAVLDSGDGQTLTDVRAYRGQMDTTRAALYYPWVRAFDPFSEREIHLPPSGFVAGIYARTDIERGVHKAPANEVVRLAVGFELLLNRGQQEVLNPEGINCLRFFEGRGFRVWGARTASSDPEWKYLNVRRYFAYLERSIDKGTQWAVFEPNGEDLWANVRATVEDFLFNEFQSNHLLGSKPAEAYFVRCDRTTMTQNDLDNGRLVCLVGVAPLRPAEFVIFRIGQKTADSRA